MIKFVHGGATDPQLFLNELDVYFGREKLEEQIESIRNHKGLWTFAFTGLANRYLLECIFDIYYQKFNFDNIEQIIFNTGKPEQVVLGGTYGIQTSEPELLAQALEHSKKHTGI